MKGQRSRAGARIRPEVRDLVKKIPKLRGSRYKRGNIIRSAVVNTRDLERVFEDGMRVTPRVLVEKGLVSRTKGRIPSVKLLADGSLTKKLLVADCQFSLAAKEKIENAGGTVQ